MNYILLFIVAMWAGAQNALAGGGFIFDFASFDVYRHGRFGGRQ